MVISTKMSIQRGRKWWIAGGEDGAGRAKLKIEGETLLLTHCGPVWVG